MKKLSKWLTSLLVIAMALTLFGSTALAEETVDPADAAETAVSGDTAAASNSVEIGVVKNVTFLDRSKGDADDEYVFELSKVSTSSETSWDGVEGFANPMSSTVTGDVTGRELYKADAFPGITFTKAGVYTFAINEKSTTNKYLKLDTVPVIVTVTVVDDTENEGSVKVESRIYTKDGVVESYAYFRNSAATVPTSLNIQKVDQDGNALQGAEFTLSQIDGDTMTLTSDADGKVCFDTLNDGYYILTEKAPENYASNMPEDGIYVVITAQTDGSCVLTYNKIENGDLGSELTAEELQSYGIVIGDDGVLTITNTATEAAAAVVTTTASTNVNTGVSDSSEMLTLIVTVLAAASVTAVVFYRKRNEA